MLKSIAIGTIFLAATLQPSWAQEPQTQIIAQWAGQQSLSAWRLFEVQSTLDSDADGHDYISGGNDIGSGTTNFYIYANDDQVQRVIRHIVELEKQGQLPPGMRIGVAVYKNAARTDWSYRPAYPKGLKQFDIMYHGK